MERRLDPTAHTLPPDSWPGSKEQPDNGRAGRPARRRTPSPPADLGASGDRPGLHQPVDPGASVAAPGPPTPEVATVEGDTDPPRAGIVATVPPVGQPLPSTNPSPPPALDTSNLTLARQHAIDALTDVVDEVVALTKGPGRRRDVIRAMLALNEIASGGGKGVGDTVTPSADGIAMAIMDRLREERRQAILEAGGRVVVDVAPTGATPRATDTA